VTHTVHRGDSVDALARRYGVSAAEIVAANSETGALTLYRGSDIVVPVLVTPAPAPVQGAFVSLPEGTVGIAYTVRRGDRLSLIGERFGVAADEIAAANGLRGWLLYVGQQLVIPVAQAKATVDKLAEGKPQWGRNCTHCMACICACPSEAIEYKNKSKGKPRYYNNGYSQS
jgi:LysM repeat protein